MNTLADVLETKGHAVHAISPSASVEAAVAKLCRQRIGALLVLDPDVERGVAGILSERDLLVRVLLRPLDPATTPVAEVMTRNVVCIEASRTVTEAMALMTHQRCRHLPVVSGGKVDGLVSIGDLVRVISRDQEFETRMLREYLAGKYPG